MAPERLWASVAKGLLKVSLDLFLCGWTGPGESRTELGHDHTASERLPPSAVWMDKGVRKCHTPGCLANAKVHGRNAGTGGGNEDGQKRMNAGVFRAESTQFGDGLCVGPKGERERSTAPCMSESFAPRSKGSQPSLPWCPLSSPNQDKRSNPATCQLGSVFLCQEQTLLPGVPTGRKFFLS